MKKRLSLLLAIFINISYFCYSQAGDGNNRKVEAIQTAYLTKELSLTLDESHRFWPVYNNYLSEIRSARKDKEDQLALQEKVLNTRKKYKDEFKRILGTDDRVNQLFVAEKNFRDILRKELIKRGLTKDD